VAFHTKGFPFLLLAPMNSKVFSIKSGTLAILPWCTALLGSCLWFYTQLGKGFDHELYSGSCGTQPLVKAHGWKELGVASSLARMPMARRGQETSRGRRVEFRHEPPPAALWRLERLAQGDRFLGRLWPACSFASAKDDAIHWCSAAWRMRTKRLVKQHHTPRK
jgi:hypothetical protein